MMKRYLLRVEVEPLEEGGYLAICPDLQGCHAEGDTVAEALENAEDVARVILELCLEKGLPLPLELQDEQAPPLVRAELLVQVTA